MIVLGCVGSSWAVLVAKSCSNCFVLYEVALVFQSSILLYQLLSVCVRFFLVVLHGIYEFFCRFNL